MAKTTTCCLFLIEMLVGVVLLLSSMTTVVVVVDAWSPLPKAAVVQPQSDMSGDSSSQQQPIAAMATSSATIRELRMPGVVPQKASHKKCLCYPHCNELINGVVILKCHFDQLTVRNENK